MKEIVSWIKRVPDHAWVAGFFSVQGVIIFGLFAVAGALWMGFTLRNHNLRVCKRISS